MIKRFIASIFAVMLLLTFSVTAFADEFEYNEYDNYNEFEQDYYDSVVFPEEDKNQNAWYSELSAIPIVIGVAAGAVTVLILLRRHSALDRQAPAPYRYNAKVKHSRKVTYK